MVVFNITKNIKIAGGVRKAGGFSERGIGLISKKEIGPEEGLWIEPCSMIHTCFMSFAIDAVFLDGNMKAVRVAGNLKPWRFSPWILRARSVLELSAGSCEGRISEGDIIEIK